MPRLTALRAEALRDLADQLRFAPRERTVRILAAVERVAGELDPDHNYAEDWLVLRLTGYRPDLHEPTTFVGSALLADLSALAERVSDAAELPAGESDLTIGDLCARWGVSRRTLERFRRDGLVGRRARDQRGAVRTVFTPAAVEAYERRRPDRVERARRFERLSGGEARRAARLVERARRRFGWSATDAHARVARRLGRSPEAVRNAAGTTSRARIGPKRSADLWASYLAGEPASSVARRVNRSPATVRRLVDRRRRQAILELTLPAFEPPIDGESLERALAHPLCREGLAFEPARTAGAFVEQARAQGPVLERDERVLTLAHTGLLVRARRLVSETDPARPAGSALDEAETALRWTERLRARIVRMHRRLALQAIETATGAPLLEAPPPAIRALHRIAMDALIEGGARHDARSGGRAAAPMNVALTRALARAPEVRAVRRSGAARAASPTAGLDDWTLRVAPWRAWLGPPEVSGLDETAARYASARFGLGGRPPLTRPEAARAAGLTVQRAARLDRPLRAARR